MLIAEPLTDPQIAAAVRAVSLYVQTHQEKLGRPPGSPDVDHSSLLRRLLSGKPLLDKPPPLRHSYPDYRLAEGEEVEVMEVWDNEHGVEPDRVFVDQDGRWAWHDKPAGVLRYNPTGDLYQLSERAAIRKRLVFPGRSIEEFTTKAKFLRKIAAPTTGGA